MPHSKARLDARLNETRGYHFGILTNLGTGANFTGATEASYSGYARIQGTTYFPDATAAAPGGSQAITVDGKEGYTISNTTAMTWGPMPSAVTGIQGIGVFTASSGGTLVATIPLAAPVDVALGERFRYEVGQIDLYEVNV